MTRPRLLLAALALAAGCDALDPTKGPTFTPGPAPTLDARAWLDAHNAARAGTLAGVTVTPVPSPALPALGWSTAAAAVAQAWAANCVYQHNAGRGNLGENIAAAYPPDSFDAAGVVGLWGSEWVGYHYDTNTCTPPAPPAPQTCGHYTQLVWRSTVNVGCAKVTCTTGWPFGGTPGNWDFWVCDYEPPGNYVGEKPY
jgi:hypothetical protein